MVGWGGVGRNEEFVFGCVLSGVLADVLIRHQVKMSGGAYMCKSEFRKEGGLYKVAGMQTFGLSVS